MYRTRRGGVPSPTVISVYAATYGQAWKPDRTKCRKRYMMVDTVNCNPNDSNFIGAKGNE